MGQFSWITQDTHESIRNNGGESPSAKRKRKAYLHDNKGNTWHEKDYEGYGEFGGKDFYELVSEMNGYEDLESGDEKREMGIDIVYGKKPYLSPNLTRMKNWTWENKVPMSCPNQGWSDFKECDY